MSEALSPKQILKDILENRGDCCIIHTVEINHDTHCIACPLKSPCAKQEFSERIKEDIEVRVGGRTHRVLKQKKINAALLELNELNKSQELV